jgi:hypothetical protein
MFRRTIMATTQREKSDFGSVASHMGEQAKDKAAEAGTKAKEMAGEAASYVGKKAEDASSMVGGRMKDLAGTIRDNSPGGAMGAATSRVADTLESGGRYLEEHGLQGIGEDMTTLIRRNPIPAVLVGIGIGFLFARATHRS